MKQKEKFARYLLIAVVFDPLFNGVAGDGPYSRNYSLSLTLKGLRAAGDADKLRQQCNSKCLFYVFTF